jgi:hypothetical protein
MTREARQSRCPETVLGWIPWYGEGTLTESQEGAVESHASECAECRAELDMIAGALFEVDADLPDPDKAFAALTARISERAQAAAASEDEAGDQAPDVHRIEHHEVHYESMDDLAQLASWALEEPADRAAETSGERAPSAEAAGRKPAGGEVIQGPWSRSSIWAAAAACVLVSLGAVAGALYSDSAFFDSSSDPNSGEATRVVDARSSGDPSYGLAAASGTPGIETGALVDVVFRETASAGQISSMLRNAGAQIVSGPSPLGVYRIRVSATGGVGPAAFLSKLRGADDGLAIFAEAVP